MYKYKYGVSCSFTQASTFLRIYIIIVIFEIEQHLDSDIW